ncbi:nitrite reductase small subunit NirD [Kocuria palustris]|uniref:nitrite reductase small subunit NirD n=1 Tax=Kocuria palustris TaxID=71999 RepID=UPI002300CAD0|nr:nitrite reductase small subunit NirD [Kocuria palustris]
MSATTAVEICRLEDLETGWGEVALVEGRQVAVFRLPDATVAAVDHADPRSGALVIARGIVGATLDGTPTIASPLYKEVYDLRTGQCLTTDAYELPVHDATVSPQGRVVVALRP